MLDTVPIESFDGDWCYLSLHECADALFATICPYASGHISRDVSFGTPVNSRSGLSYVSYFYNISYLQLLYSEIN
jgi:hypothetical protein